jgi:hypothetical protein
MEILDVLQDQVGKYLLLMMMTNEKLSISSSRGTVVRKVARVIQRQSIV